MKYRGGILLSGRELEVVTYVIENSPVSLVDLENWIMKRYNLSLSAAYKIVYKLKKSNILRYRRFRNKIFVEVTPEFIATITKLYALLLSREGHRVRYFEQQR